MRDHSLPSPFKPSELESPQAYTDSGFIRLGVPSVHAAEVSIHNATVLTLSLDQYPEAKTQVTT